MFIIITALILGVVMALGLVSIKFLFSEHLAKKFYKLLAVADLIFIGVIIGGWLVRSMVPDWFVSIFGNVATIFLTAQLICGVLVVCAVVVRFVYRKFNPPTEFDPAKRRALVHGMIYPVASLAISLYGNRIEKNTDVENFYDVPIKDLPPDLEGFRLAQISDIHLGAYYSLERLEALLQRVADAKPDLLAITGDIFDDVTMNPAAIQLVNSFTDKFKHGIYYIHGNHEHFRGIYQIEQMIKQTNIKMIVNRGVNVTGKLYILGVDYPSRAPITSSSDEEQAERFKAARKTYMAGAMNNVPADAVKILLAHHPEFIDDGAENNCVLTLTGHTHGAQIGIFGVPLFPVFKYTRGIIKHGDSIGYVHCGNGFWFPLRIGCPPEIAYFTLKTK